MRLLDVLWNDPHLSEDGHAIGISVPSGHDVKMHMILETGPCDNTQIQAHIKTFRIHDLLQNINGFSNHM